MGITPSKQNATEDYSDFQNNLNNIGALIKKTREEKNLTIEALAENLKINKSYLYAIENGDCKSLPEIIYVKAMIRRIAEKLKLDLEIQTIFGKESKANNDDSTKAEEIKTRRFKKSFFLLPLLALATFFLGALSVKVGLEWLLIKNEPIENSIQNPKK